MTTLNFSFLTPLPGPNQVPDEDEEFDWIQISETPC
jgi:hypothetical protein